MAEYLKQNILPATKQFQHYDIIYITFKENGVSLDLTGYTFTMEFRLASTDGTLVKKLILTAGQLEIVEVIGVSKLKIHPFSLDTAGKIFYDIRMKSGSIVKYHVGGSVLVTSSATKQDN
jgi:hypothetical protein